MSNKIGAFPKLDYNGAEKFLSPSDVLAVLMLQHNAFHVCADAGVNKPTAPASRMKGQHTVTYGTCYLMMIMNNCVASLGIYYTMCVLEQSLLMKKKFAVKQYAVLHQQQPHIPMFTGSVDA